jgi:uncharacterized protein
MSSFQTLVVLQPTTFCNLDCAYCYLPERQSAKRMRQDVAKRIVQEVFASSIAEDPVVFLWHLGEPLAVPPSFYEEIFEFTAREAIRTSRSYSQSFQTNATLIDDRWVDLIKRHNVRIGVSIDGPDFIHDGKRGDRRGRGSHSQVMRGVRRLQAAGVPFSVIMVVTDNSLDHPDAICDFFLSNGIEDIGFNIDEIEGINAFSSFANSTALERYRHFVHRLVDRSYGSNGKLRVREFWTHLRNLMGADPEPVNTTNQPFRIFNFDVNGNYSTFCPELVAASSPEYRDFRMGNILDGPLERIRDNPVFKRVQEEIDTGVEKCKMTCAYWSVCGGGSPSNKFFEHGRFDVAETIACRVHKQATVDVLVEYIEANVLPVGAISPVG